MKAAINVYVKQIGGRISVVIIITQTVQTMHFTPQGYDTKQSIYQGH